MHGARTLTILREQHAQGSQPLTSCGLQSSFQVSLSCPCLVRPWADSAAEGRAQRAWGDRFVTILTQGTGWAAQGRGHAGENTAPAPCCAHITDGDTEAPAAEATRGLEQGGRRTQPYKDLLHRRASCPHPSSPRADRPQLPRSAAGTRGRPALEHQDLALCLGSPLAGAGHTPGAP